MKEAKRARRINGRVIAITGAARGIGFATAKALHERGAKVVIGDIDEVAVKAAASTVDASGEGVESCKVDITDEASFVAFVAHAENRFGPLDVLINNAGIMPIGPFLDESNALSKKAFDINVMGPIIGMRSALPGMIARGGGHIVNVASAAGKSPVPGGLVYSATKAGVIAATETARVEFAKSGVFFTCVMPSFTNTELISGTPGTKLIRNVEPGEVAEAIVRAIANKETDVYMPRIIGPILKTQPLIGRRLRDWINHRIGADSTFLTVDHEARRGYDARINGSPTSAASPRKSATKGKS